MKTTQINFRWWARNNLAKYLAMFQIVMALFVVAFIVIFGDWRLHRPLPFSAPIERAVQAVEVFR